MTEGATGPIPAPEGARNAAVGGQELVFILVLALLFFGGKKLPELGSSVGHSIQNFKRSVAEGGGDTPSPRPGAADDPPAAPVAESSGTAGRS